MQVSAQSKPPQILQIFREPLKFGSDGASTNRGAHGASQPNSTARTHIWGLNRLPDPKRCVGSTGTTQPLSRSRWPTTMREIPSFLPRLKDLVAFLPVNCGFGGLHVVRGAGLDLDKTQGVIVPANQVDFAASVGRTKITGGAQVLRAIVRRRSATCDPVRMLTVA